MANKSVTVKLLKALIPYSEENLKLAFKPGSFFKDLEKTTNSNRNTLAATMSRAKKRGLVSEIRGVPVLTDKGRDKIPRVRSADLMGGWLLVVFDVPENRRKDRYHLRRFLKARGFKQLQKSVWYTDRDHAVELRETVSDLKLENHVRIFLAAQTQLTDIQ